MNVTVALSPASATEVNDARSAAAAVARGCQLPACSMILGVSVLQQLGGYGSLLPETQAEYQIARMITNTSSMYSPRIITISTRTS